MRMGQGTSYTHIWWKYIEKWWNSIPNISNFCCYMATSLKFGLINMKTFMKNVKYEMWDEHRDFSWVFIFWKRVTGQNHPMALRLHSLSSYYHRLRMHLLQSSSCAICLTIYCTLMMKPVGFPMQDFLFDEESSEKFKFSSIFLSIQRCFQHSQFEDKSKPIHCLCDSNRFYIVIAYMCWWVSVQCFWQLLHRKHVACDISKCVCFE